MATRQMVLTAVGPDGTGRVKDVSSFLLDCGCNLEDNRMAVLAGEFAMIVLFSGEQEALERVRKGYQALATRLDFQFTLRETARHPKVDRPHYDLHVHGVDQPGIVYAASKALAELEINVLSLESYLRPAAFSGTPVFHFDALIEIPTDAARTALEGALASICEENNLNFVLEPSAEDS